MEDLRKQGRISSRDLSRVYAGAYLAFFTYMERSIEAAFLGILMGRYVSSDGARPLVAIKSETVAQRVIAGDRAYADWIPYRLTKKRAEAFLSGGRPFSSVSKADANVLEQLATLRNAIAHESAHSVRQFQRAFTINKSLPPAQFLPPGYLRGQHAVGQTRLNFLLSQGVSVITRMLV